MEENNTDPGAHAFALSREGNAKELQAWLGEHPGLNVDAFRSKLQFVENDGKISVLYQDVTALCAACAGGHVDCVKLLLARGANAMWASLMAACAGNIAVIALLLEGNERVALENGHLDDALDAAARLENLPLVQFLLQSNANPRARSYNDAPVLNRASQAGNCTIVQLLDAKADTSDTDKDGRNALFRVQNLECARLLLTYKADLNAKTLDDKIPLFMVQNAEIAKFFVEQKADLEARSKFGTPLASVSWYPEQFEPLCALLELKAEVNVPVGSVYSPLGNASYRAVHDTMRVLLENKANVTQLVRRLEPPLVIAMNALTEDEHTAVRVLVQHKSDVNQVSGNNQNTPLMYAQSTPTMQFLIDQKANVTARNREGATPLLMTTQRWKCAGSMRVLVASGADLCDVDYNGRSAFHYSSFGDPECITMLMKSKVDINARSRTREGHTPLLEAIKKRAAFAVSQLLAHGADVNLRERLTGYTAIMLACVNHNNGTCKTNRDCMHLECQPAKQFWSNRYAPWVRKTTFSSWPMSGCLELLLCNSEADIHARVSDSDVTDALHIALSYLSLDQTDPRILYRHLCVFMLLCCGSNIQGVKLDGDRVSEEKITLVTTRYNTVHVHIEAVHYTVKDALEVDAVVDNRFYRRANGLYHEPLEHVLEYLGLRMEPDQVLNTSLDPDGTLRVISKQWARHWYVHWQLYRTC